MLTRRTGLKRTAFNRSGIRLRPCSQRRKNQMTLYFAKRKRFLAAHPWCELAPTLFGTWLPSRDLHHRLGRIGSNYLDESTWMALSRISHTWVHDHPSEARSRGWLG